MDPTLLDQAAGLLRDGVAEVFQTMLSMKAEPGPVSDPRTSGQPLIAGSVGFIGDANGVACVHVTAAFARCLASQLLGLPEAELQDGEMIRDVVGELTNMIVGSVKSRLCDAGLSCVLTIPTVVSGQSFRIEPVGAAQIRMLGFACGAHSILVELVMRPAEPRAQINAWSAARLAGR